MKDIMGKEGDRDFYHTTRLDLAFITVLLFLSIASFWVIHKRFQPSSGASAICIYQKDKLLEESGLDKDKIITILGGKMQLEIKDGRIRVLNTDCPHNICKNMGWIKYNGETIVCVPNQILIEIKSNGPAVIDAVAY